MAFLPITKDEALKRGWDELDVVFVTGDAYIDHPAFGVPLLARWLEFHGFRVGIIPQPDWRSKEAFMALGRPRLFFAVSSGAMDSMVAHYTPARKLRHDDAYTPGNRHGARPNRATIVYTSCCKAAYRDVPVVLGGIEASLRRFAHYDYWEDKVRRSILFDAKADLLIYGMAERPLLELAERLRRREEFDAIRDIRGTAFIGTGPGTGSFSERKGACPSAMAERKGASPPSVHPLPSFEEVASDKAKYAKAFRFVAQEQNPYSARTVVQGHGGRSLVCNPPALPMTGPELDAVYALPFTRAPHPSYKEPIPAYEQIKTSITTHRGCYGGCAFCAITHHQGKVIQSRSEQSILDEIKRLKGEKWFRGNVSDLGGPTANMYASGCGSPVGEAACKRSSCLWPEPCRHLAVDDRRAADLLKKVRSMPGIRNSTVSSGIRCDLLERQPAYMAELLSHHVGGLLKVAPEHLVDRVTAIMRKPGKKAFERFLALFRGESSRLGKTQYIVPYLMSGHPGCTLDDMVELALALRKNGLRVEQVQDFTPTPGTLATCMFHTGIDPFSGATVHVARSDREKILQKALLLSHLPEERRNVLAALKACGLEAAASELLTMRAGKSRSRGGK